MRLQWPASSLMLGTRPQQLWACTGILFFCVLICKSFTHDVFITTPKKHMFINVGGDLEINCTINEEDGDIGKRANVHKLRILYGKKRLAPEMFTYYPSQLTIQLLIRNVTFADAGMYLCYYGKKKALKKINIGLPPGKPQNIHCISYDFLNMTCFVQLSKLDTRIPKNWTMQFRMTRWWTDMPKTYCSCYNISCQCSWNSVNQPPTEYTFNRADFYRIRVNVKNRLGTSSSDIIKIDQKSIVKPAPVYDLGYNFTNMSDTLQIYWTLSLNCDLLDIIFNITVTSQEHWDERSLIYKPQFSGIQYQFQIEKLIPSANYSLTVQSRPSRATSDIYWSDRTEVQLHTKSSVPKHSTSLIAGSFYMENCSINETCIVLYWKNPARRYHHGDIKVYKVVVLPSDNHQMTSSASVTFPQNSSTVTGGAGITEYSRGSRNKSVQLNPEYPENSENITGFRVCSALQTRIKKTDESVLWMKAATEVGFSHNVSDVITIPRWKEGSELRVSLVTVEIDGGKVRVSWQMKGDHCTGVTKGGHCANMTKGDNCDNITEVSYYWCSKDKDTSHHICKNDLDWFSTSVHGVCHGDAHQWLEITENPLPVMLQFAVSIAASGISGGMVWETFRFRNYNAVPEKPIYRLECNSTVIHVKILYNRDYYTSMGGRPDVYMVSYTAESTEDKSPVPPSDASNISYPVDFANPVLTISGLQAGTLYLVYVRSANKNGISEYGEQQYIWTADDSTKVTVVAVSISLVVLVMVTMFICICKSKVKKFHKDYMTQFHIQTLKVDVSGDSHKRDSYYETPLGGRDSPPSSIPGSIQPYFHLKEEDNEYTPMLHDGSLTPDSAYHGSVTENENSHLIFERVASQSELHIKIAETTNAQTVVDIDTKDVIVTGSKNLEYATEVKGNGEYVTEVKGNGEYVTEVKGNGEYVTEVKGNGEYITEVKGNGEYVTEVKGNGKYVTEVTGNSEYVTEVKRNGECVTEVKGNVKYVTEVKGNGEFVTEVKGNREYVTEVKGNGECVTEVKGNGEYVTEVKGNGEYVTEVKGNGKYVTEVKGNSEYVTEVKGNGECVTEVKGNVKYVTEVKGNGEFVTEVIGNREYVTEVKGNGEGVTEVKRNSEYCTEIKGNRECVTEVKGNRECVTEVKGNGEYVTEIKGNKEYVTEAEGNGEYVTEVKRNGEYVTEVKGNREYVTEVKGNREYVTEVKRNREYVTDIKGNGEYVTEVKRNGKYVTEAKGNGKYVREVKGNGEYVTKAEGNMEFVTETERNMVLVTETEWNMEYVTETEWNMEFVTETDRNMEFVTEVDVDTSATTNDSKKSNITSAYLDNIDYVDETILSLVKHRANNISGVETDKMQIRLSANEQEVPRLSTNEHEVPKLMMPAKAPIGTQNLTLPTSPITSNRQYVTVAEFEHKVNSSLLDTDAVDSDPGFSMNGINSYVKVCEVNDYHTKSAEDRSTNGGHNMYTETSDLNEPIYVVNACSFDVANDEDGSFNCSQSVNSYVKVCEV